jgi:nucleotide-binding universal stress UspA family protein
MSGNKVKVVLVGGLIGITTIIHYLTPKHLMYMHVLLQAFFFVPVSLSAWWFGKKGGIVSAGVVAAVYLYHAITVMMPTSEMAASNSIQIVLLFIVGALTGTYIDVKRSYEKALIEPDSPSGAAFPADRSLLVYVDGSGASMNAVRYVANMFGQMPDMKVTLLNVVRKPNPDLYASQHEHQEEEAKVLESSRSATERAYTLLIESGFPQTHIETHSASVQNTRSSDVILKEQKSGRYSAIVVGRHGLSRTEEFLFGSPAITLARKASCPVWVIGETPAEDTAAQNAGRLSKDRSDAAKANQLARGDN